MPLGNSIRGKIVERVTERMEDRGYPVVQNLIENSPLMQNIINSLLTPEVIESGDFYERFKEDLKNADKPDEIRIYSPFTHKTRIEDIKEILEKASPNILIYTRDSDNFGGDKKDWQERNISTLENISGVDVARRDRMHEKAVIIGEDIAYFGSLNVLSRLQEKGGGDYMLRYEGPSAGDLIENYRLEMG